MLTAFFVGAGSSAHAETKPLARAGNWQAFGGTVLPDDLGVCGVSQSTADDSYFGLKLFAGKNGFTVQVGRKGWKFADKQKLNVIMRVDRGTPWTTVGVGMHFTDGDSGLEFTIGKDQFAGFNAVFRSGSELHIQVESLQDWALDLTGSNAISAALQDCIRGLR
jgi:hypothetical protein